MDRPWKVISAFVGVFIFGSIFGGLLALRVDQRAGQRRGGPPPSQQPPGGALPGIMRHFAERLELTPEQREKIRPMVERAEADIRHLRQTSLRDTGILIKRLQEDFAGELTPVQRRKLEKMQERQREVLRENRSDRTGSAPPRDKSGGKRGTPATDFQSKDASLEAPLEAPQPSKP